MRIPPPRAPAAAPFLTVTPRSTVVMISPFWKMNPRPAWEQSITHLAGSSDTEQRMILFPRKLTFRLLIELV